MFVLGKNLKEAQTNKIWKMNKCEYEFADAS